MILYQKIRCYFSQRNEQAQLGTNKNTVQRHRPPEGSIQNWRFYGLIYCLFVTINLAPPLFAQADQERPNIVWLVTEDNAWHYLRLYQEGGAAMPHVEKLAESGIVFNHAFSNAPVCSVARSTIISGCYAPRIGAQYHRRMQLAPMPDGLEMFPYYLREAGYYTTNNSKEDYNLIKSDGVWDESSGKASYRHRAKGQPFFHVQNFGITHEGQLHFSKAQMEKATTANPTHNFPQFEYHPNSPTFEYTYAHYLELNQQADAAIGEFIAQLEEDGLLENTFIFYYGDHGGVLPRSKGYIYESGLHVPLVVYVPEKWEKLVPNGRGSRNGAFVQFIDLAPTVLHLAGINVPKQMDGRPFLGDGIGTDDWEARNTAFSYADRFDEKYDLVRGIRRGKYKYIRNYQPFNIDGLYNFYRYKMLAYQEWKTLFDKGKLNALQQQFFLPRAPEALYDLEKDPNETNNLAKDADHQEVLEALRSALQEQVTSMPDLSFYPEPYFLKEGIENPVAFGQTHQKHITRLVEIADLSLVPFKKAKQQLRQALASENPWERYWGLIVCSTFGKEAKVFLKEIQRMAKEDSENLVRARAAEYLGLHTDAHAAPLLVEILKQASSESEANLILNTVALLKDRKPGFPINLSKGMFKPEWLKEDGSVVNRRLDYIRD